MKRTSDETLADDAYSNETEQERRQKAAMDLLLEVQTKADAARSELRDRFAMAALTGITASLSGCEALNAKPIARLAYELADAMLAAREVKP